MPSVIRERVARSGICLPECDRTEPRFVVSDRGSELAFVTHVSFWPTKHQSRRIRCELSDLSQSGCAIRYRWRNPIPMATALLEFGNLSHSDAIRTICRVCWSNRSGIDSFISGLYFREPLSEDLLLTSIAEGQLTRRSGPRLRVQVPALIRQSNPSMSGNAMIVCSSESGCQVVCDERSEVGSRLMLALPCGTTVIGATAWCERKPSQFASGVAFAKRTAGSLFHEAVRRDHQRRTSGGH